MTAIACRTCGGAPCPNPSFCHQCREADRKRAGAEPPRPKPNGSATVPNVVPLKAQETKVTPPPSLDSARASAYQIRGITWFWPSRFALGKLGLIGGLPDKGKGLISADIIARCTTGGEWPCKE